MSLPGHRMKIMGEVGLLSSYTAPKGERQEEKEEGLREELKKGKCR